MDLVATWGWPAWTIAVLLAGFLAWRAWRMLSALVFRHFLLAGLLRRHGWQAERAAGDPARADFERQRRQQQREGAEYLRQGGWRNLRAGYRSGPFGKPTASSRHADLVISGAYRGRGFLATQTRGYQQSVGERVHVTSRHRASLELHVVPAPFEAGSAVARFEARTGPLTGSVRGAPPGLEALVASRRFRTVRCDGATLFVSLGPAIRRGPLLAGLAHLSRIADGLQERR